MNTTKTHYEFANRMNNIPVSFIREVLKTATQPEVISFAGGLPNPELFPVEHIEKAAHKVLSEQGKSALQYTISEGYLPLRQWICERYSRQGLIVSPEEILITNGSQQGLDLIGKAFINPGDAILMENPGYMGAIQSFSACEPNFHSVDMMDDGINMHDFREKLSTKNIKLFYCVPNFQNPTGITYSLEKRKEIADIISNYNTIIIEDDPYREIRFSGEHISPIRKFLPDQNILLGSFSKIISPGMRLGWVLANRKIIEKLTLLKQATDLHTNLLSQKIIYQYLTSYSLDEHILKLIDHYRKNRDLMLAEIEKYFPQDISITIPEGGMFVWVTFPERLKACEILDNAVREQVLFVPGKVFYILEPKDNSIRLNFSNTSPELIKEGIKRLGRIFNEAI